jgi:hypothetical protein
VSGVPFDFNHYVYCVREIQRRAQLFLLFCEPAKTSGDQYEIACLHGRKTVELIALASLSCNRQKYEQINTDFKRIGFNDRLLNKIQKINDDPFPKKYSKVENDLVVFSNIAIKGSTLLKAYGHFSDGLHVANPYGITSIEDIPGVTVGANHRELFPHKINGENFEFCIGFMKTVRDVYQSPFITLARERGKYQLAMQCPSIGGVIIHYSRQLP